MAKKASAEPFEPDLIGASAKRALAAVTDAGDRAEDLIRAWVDASNVEAVAEVAERGDGPSRKAARRALGVLKSRGIRPPGRRRVATLASSGEPAVEAWMMAPDAAGIELFAIGSRPPAGRTRVCLVFLHASQGIARVDHRTLSQSQLKEYFSKLMPGAGYGAITVPVQWARWRIREARRSHTDRGGIEPLGFSTARDLLEPIPGEAPPHPFDQEGLEIADEDALEMAQRSADLHRLPEFRGWLPSQEAMRELLTEVGKKLSPGDEPDPETMNAHLVEEIARATDRYFSPQLREELVAKMKDSALSVLSREGEHASLEVVAAMRAIERCGLVTNPPHEVPFLKAFFEKAVGSMLAQGGGRLRVPVPRAPMTDAAPAGDEAAEPQS